MTVQLLDWGIWLTPVYVYTSSAVSDTPADPLFPGLVCFGKFYGNAVALAAATTAQRILIHGPQETGKSDEATSTLRLSSAATALAAGVLPAEGCHLRYRCWEGHCGVCHLRMKSIQPMEAAAVQMLLAAMQVALMTHRIRTYYSLERVNAFKRTTLAGTAIISTKQC